MRAKPKLLYVTKQGFKVFDVGHLSVRIGGLARLTPEERGEYPEEE